MELGNLIFGNSRGEYPINRDEGFEEALIKLFDAIDKDRDNSWREYGVEFENDVFSLFPYYWGDCECDWGNRWNKEEEGWARKNKHSPNCYIKDFEKLENEFKKKYGSCFGLEGKQEKEYLSRIEQLYIKHKLEYDKKDIRNGCAVRCSCGYEEKWNKFVEQFFKDRGEHPITCPAEKPNFHYKPADYRLKWYKYPLRDSYANQKLSLKEFKDIINKCIKGCKK